MDELPSTSSDQRSRRWTAMCGAAFAAAALFTPVPATAEVTGEAAPPPSSTTASSEVDARQTALAQSLISTGMIGIGLAMGGLVIVTHRRRQW